jgi:Alternative complex III, ActD subunit
MSKAKNYIVGIFDDQDVLLDSIGKIQAKGLKIDDVSSPFPIHEVFDKLGLKTRMPILALLYGIFAIGVTFAFLYWTSVIDYPLRFGGKPQNTLSFIIVIFVMTINITSLFTIFTFFFREKKGPGAKAHVISPDLTDDKFAIIIDEEKNMEIENADNIGSFLTKLGATRIVMDSK